MTWILVLIAFLILGAAAVAMAWRNLIHSALLLVVAWAGIAAFYLWAGAEFVAFAQALVYVGAVSMIVLFAVLLTRPNTPSQPSRADLRRAASALLVGGAVAGILLAAIFATPLPTSMTQPPTLTVPLTVREIGHALMGSHVAALLILGAILTVALLGAVVIAAGETSERKP